ncbi:HNH endonuclease [Natronomonas sp.]|uniref:HNH endonuclease n=1 Tax=Natronomonas sp. TaxID=2184060 RepID=UPI002FC35AAC
MPLAVDVRKLARRITSRVGRRGSEYVGRWQSIKMEALERDDHACRRCGKTREEIGKEPDVNHLIPVRAFDDPQEAHRLLNVVCLCPSCHSTVEHQAEVSGLEK